MFAYQVSGPVMDKLAGTLLPEDFPDPKKSDSKPKVIRRSFDTLCSYMNFTNAPFELNSRATRAAIILVLALIKHTRV